MNFLELKKISMWRRNLALWLADDFDQSELDFDKVQSFSRNTQHVLIFLYVWRVNALTIWERGRSICGNQPTWKFKSSRMSHGLGCSSCKSCVKSHMSKLFSIFWIGRNRKIVIFWLFSKLYSFGCFPKNHVFGLKVLATTKMR